ncbi:Pyrophosphate--fructose_6-phosphate 1-phosphotransferase [Hexamita inflata]|uniref:Pyrophosphate--fructose 6-phosphate 1-phosphotransferase n=1 Tax=Hexamita inflata TaxID=28002 RepID=Q95V79_9EUKA|nr:putative pyrophosphate-dependent phosphofructokinase [Hexamita inflata]CAI9933563.1 Pyrophosphate--fructose 6-phosphate 1-phosphotransferase [Hexamita inflata]CAI9971664.1 Pyrophosphate--fructose 6-phosphate 1-phosphotransferase [Hexamita inflata]
MSTFELYRRQYNPLLPASLQGTGYTLKKGEPMAPVADGEEIAKQFPMTTNLPAISIEPSTEQSKLLEPLTIGVIFSGGQAPGGHNVLCGLYDKLQQLAPNSKLLGFLGGPKGLMDNKHMILTKEYLATFRNMGGFHAIGSGRDKIASTKDFDAAANTAAVEKLDGLVIIGGDDSNTNACLLAEDFIKRGLKTRVIGVPKTIDRDLISKRGIETSFGFDTSCKVYSELIGNLCYDALSAKKYWHFIRLMGRSASHITLECGLQTHPNICLIGEEILAKNMTSKQVFEYMADIIAQRAANGKNYGICLIPEGLIEFIPENNKLFDYLNNKLLPGWQGEITAELVAQKLPADLKVTFESIPPTIRTQLLLDRDPHGNIAISQIETEKFLVSGVQQVIKERELKIKFSALYHFFGYEGRCAAPSAFDSSYCYGLGSVAAVLLGNGITGYMSCLKNLSEQPDKWIAGAIPLTSLMNIEMRHGARTAVIQKQMVDLAGRPFGFLVVNREKWAEQDCYQQPGPIQLIECQDVEGRNVVYQSSVTLLEEARGL